MKKTAHLIYLWIAFISSISITSAHALENKKLQCCTDREILEALSKEDYDTLQDMLNKGLDINKKTINKMNLVEASYNMARFGSVAFLIEKGADPNADVNGNSILANLLADSATDKIYSKKKNIKTSDTNKIKISLAKTLIRKGANTKTQYKNSNETTSFSIIFYAILTENLEIIKQVTEKELTGEPSKTKKPPIFYAIQTKNMQIVDLILSHNGDLNSIDTSSTFKESAAEFAASIFPEVIYEKTHLISDNILARTLKPALIQKNHHLLKLLIEHGITLDSFHHPEHAPHLTPLTLAAENNDKKSIEILLNGGANPCIRNSSNENFIDITMRKNHKEITEFLTSLTINCPR